MAIEVRSLASYLEAKREIESMPLGHWLRSARRSAGISQAALASSASVTQAYISQIENGTRTPSNSSLENIINVLDSTGTVQRSGLEGGASAEDTGQGNT